MLSLNPNAVELLIENQSAIYAKRNPKKINWNMLSKTPNALELLKENQDKN